MQNMYNFPELPLEPPEPDPVGKCKFCGDDIYEGDEIIQYNGDEYHRDCFAECALEILLIECGAKACVAERPEPYED